MLPQKQCSVKNIPGENKTKTTTKKENNNKKIHITKQTKKKTQINPKQEALLYNLQAYREKLGY